MTRHSAVCVWMPLVTSITSTIRSMICAPPMIVRMSDAWPGQSTSVTCARGRRAYHGRAAERARADRHRARAHLHLIVRLGPQMLGHLGHERGEAEVERDAALLALRVLVERRRRADGAQRAAEARLARVDVPEDPDVHVERAVRLRAGGLCLRHEGMEMCDSRLQIRWCAFPYSWCAAHDNSEHRLLRARIVILCHKGVVQRVLRARLVVWFRCCGYPTLRLWS